MEDPNRCCGIRGSVQCDSARYRCLQSDAFRFAYHGEAKDFLCALRYPVRTISLTFSEILEQIKTIFKFQGMLRCLLNVSLLAAQFFIFHVSKQSLVLLISLARLLRLSWSIIYSRKTLNFKLIYCVLRDMIVCNSLSVVTSAPCHSKEGMSRVDKEIKK